MSSEVPGIPALGTNGLLYAATSDGHVLALDAITGAPMWETNLGGTVSGSCYVGPEGNVYVGQFRDGFQLCALDGNSGAQKWAHVFDELPVAYPSVAIGADGTLYVVAGSLSAIDPNNGTVKWEWYGDVLAAFGHPILGANGLLFVGAPIRKVIAVDTAIGQRVWEFVVEDVALTPVAIGANGTLYVMGEILNPGGYFNTLYALDSSTGKRLWEFQVQFVQLASLVIGEDGALYLSASDNVIRVLNAQTGNLQRELVLPSGVRSALTLTGNGTVYLGQFIPETSTEHIFAIDTVTGGRNWSVDSGGYYVSGFNVAEDGTVYFHVAGYASLGQRTGFVAVYGEDGLAHGAWPKPLQNNQNSGYWRVVGAPELTKQPQSQWAAAGGSARLDFYSPVARPLNIQWRFNGEAIPGATNESFRIAHVQFTNAGRYSVVVSNAFGRAESEEALLSIGYRVVLNTIGPGVVETNPNLEVFPTNSVVELTAVGQGSRRFLGWTGDVASASNSVTLTLDRNYELTAAFEYLPGDVKWISRHASAAHALGTNGILYSATKRDTCVAVDIASGRELWEVALSGNIEGPPAVGPDGTVYLGDYGEAMNALDGTTGAKKWRFDLNRCVHTCATFGMDGTLFLAGDKLYAVDPATGTELWSFAGAGEVSPAIGADGTVYACGDALYALNGFTGQKKWEFPGSFSSPAPGPDGVVYVGSWDRKVYAIDAQSGAPLWEFQTGGPCNASPIVGPDRTVYIYSADGKVYAIDGKTGAKRWEIWGCHCDYGVTTTPALAADGTLCVSTYSGWVFGIDSLTGAEMWKVELGRAEYGEGGPTIGPDGTIYIEGYALHGISPLAAGGWPQFHGTPNNAGRLSSGPLLNPVRSRLTPLGFEIVAHSERGDVLAFEWTGDWQTWNLLAIGTNQSGMMQVIDAGAGKDLKRFYRAISQGR